MILLEIDQQISVTTNRWLNQSVIFDWLVRLGSEITVYIIPIILLVLWFLRKPLKELAVFMTGAGLISWLGISNLIGAIWYRPRPFLTGGIQELIFHRPDKSFPSDHAAFMLAITWIAFRFGYKKLGLLLVLLDLIMAFSRVVAGIHYTGDILVGAIIGILTAEIICQLRKPLTRYLVDPIINFASKIHLTTRL